jgi:hypothetical protein
MTSVYDPDDDEARPLTNGNGKHHHRSATRPSLCERMATPVLLAAILVVTALAPGREPASTEAVLPPPPPAPPAPPFPQWHKLDGAAADAPVGVWWDDNGDAALLIGHPQDAGGIAANEICKDKVDTGYQMLLVNYVTKGVGVHNAYDSGLPSGTKLVEFRKAGPKIQLVALPAQHRALSDDPNVVAGVGRSFAESVLWTFDVAHDFGGGYILDATGYMLRNWDDSTDFIAGLKRGYGADYTLDRTRSAVVQGRSKATPGFSCLEADLTYVAAENPAGPLGRALATSHAVTVSVRVSFVAIPQEGDDDFYSLRQQHPKSSFSSLSFTDDAESVLLPREQHFIRRHRLEKVDPSCVSGCAAKEPIVYYLDNGCPEPIRSAVLTGVGWWDDAFQAAGWAPGTFQIHLQPAGVDLMDIDGSHAIQWVHRDFRGWSSGSSVVDPRTGEIVKGHVRLGSLRARQDALIGLSMLQPRSAATATQVAEELDDVLQMVRMRHAQLGAHEVGHTLGLAHNFMGSAACAGSNSDRAAGRGGGSCIETVMDYPGPMIGLDAATGNVVLDEGAYEDRIGQFDIDAIKYGYTQFAPGSDESQQLQGIIDQAEADGYMFLSNQDEGGQNPAPGYLGLDWRDTKWDTADDPAAALAEARAVRGRAMSSLDERALALGEPWSDLQDMVAVAAVFHRYQIESAGKAVGGVEFQYTAHGDALEQQQVALPTAASTQRACLTELLLSVAPAELVVPEPLRQAALPIAYGQTGWNIGNQAEWFGSRIGKTFDPLAPAEVVAGLVFDMLLEPGRTGRLALQADYDPTLPTLVEVLDACSNAVLGTSTTPITSTLSTPTELSTAYVVASVYLHRLLELIPYGSFRVAGAVTDAIDSAGMRLSAAAADPSLAGTGRELDWAYLAEKARAGQPFMDRVLPIPDGAPI